MAKPKFRRTDGHNYSKLGVRRKKKQIYRKSKGRDNKIRLNMKGHVRKVRIGFRTKKDKRDLIKGKKIIRIFNVKDLDKIKQGMVGVIGKIGNKKKKELAEKVLKDEIRLLNLNAKEFLKKIKEKIKEKEERRTKRAEKVKVKDKKVKEKEKKEEAEKKTEAKDKSDKLEDKLSSSENNSKQVGLQGVNNINNMQAQRLEKSKKSKTNAEDKNKERIEE